MVWCALVATACGGSTSMSKVGTECTVDSAGCHCSYDDTPNKTQCDSFAVTTGDGVCCAYVTNGSWPDAYGHCECQSGTPTCVQHSGYCSCYPGELPMAGETVAFDCSAPSGGRCCHDDGNYCACHGAYACDADQHEVLDCNDTTPLCPSNEIKVDACSI